MIDCFCARAASALAVLLAWGVSLLPVSAQDVALESLDGSVRLEGTLRAYDGAYYQIESDYGPLTVAADGVRCAGPGCPDLTTFVAEARIAGAQDVADRLLPALFAGFAETQGLTLYGPGEVPGGHTYRLHRSDGSLAARFVVLPGTTDAAFLALLNRDADMALTLRPPTDLERRAARTAEPDDPPLSQRVRVLALDALVPIVAPQNPVQTIGLGELAAAFAGEIDDWQSLGGPEAPLALHLLAPTHGLAQNLAGRLTDLPSSRVDTGPRVTRHPTATNLSRAVAGDAYALGIAPFSALGPARALPLRGACGFVQEASAAAIRAEDYPLTAPIYLYLAPQRLPQLVRQFLAFTETDAAERIVAEAGFVNQSLTRTGFALQGLRLGNAISAAGDDIGLGTLQAMVARLAVRERLSSTFRFGEGSVSLDPQSRAAAARLAAAIDRGMFDGRSLLFVGFSDGEGAAEVNERLSRQRAVAAKDAVMALLSGAADRVSIEVDAFGEALPMACDDDAWGRAVNRRVEVWLR
jgi:phosphate transport system substrate-binding protein